MTIHEWLRIATSKLDASSVPTAKLDAEVLLADLLGKDRSWLHSHPEHTLQRSDLRRLDEQIERRMLHEPIAYIRGKQEFFGREFLVSADTLTPRPETETLVEVAIKIMGNNHIESVADIGTGSGCIIISLSLESNVGATFVGYDISDAALGIAQKNASLLNSGAVFIQDDITENKNNEWCKAEMIVANLPYVPDDFHINLAASHEPPFAIYGGADGLDYYRIMFEKIQEKTRYVLTESLPPQHEEMIAIAKKHGYSILETRDLIQVFKRG